MMIRPEKGNISENGVVSLGCDALTDLTADEVLSVVEKRLKIEIGVCKRAGRFTQDRFDFTGRVSVNINLYEEISISIPDPDYQTRMWRRIHQG